MNSTWHFMMGAIQGALVVLALFFATQVAFGMFREDPGSSFCTLGSEGICCDICNLCRLEWDNRYQQWHCETVTSRCLTEGPDCDGCTGDCASQPIEDWFMGNFVLHCPCLTT